MYISSTYEKGEKTKRNWNRSENNTNENKNKLSMLRLGNSFQQVMSDNKKQW